MTAPRLAQLLPFVSLLACPSEPSEPPSIEPPAGCSSFAYETVAFEFTIHFGGVDYSQDALVELLAGNEFWAWGFPGEVTELSPTGDGREAVTITELPAEGEEPPQDPNFVQVVYQLPAGYSLPIEAGDAAGVDLVLALGEDLLRAIAVSTADEAGQGRLQFFAEANDIGTALPPGDSHPLFAEVETVDRNCPELRPLPCGAERYNLATRFVPHAGEDDPPAAPLELWPTESATFAIDGAQFEVVNAWSFTHRDLGGCEGTGYDYAAERSSWFVLRRG